MGCFLAGKTGMHIEGEGRETRIFPVNHIKRRRAFL
jgi:hypothetical protein